MRRFRRRRSSPRFSGQSFNKLIPNLITVLAVCFRLSGLRFALAGQWELAVAMIVLAAVFAAHASVRGEMPQAIALATLALAATASQTIALASIYRSMSMPRSAITSMIGSTLRSARVICRWLALISRPRMLGLSSTARASALILSWLTPFMSEWLAGRPPIARMRSCCSRPAPP